MSKIIVAVNSMITYEELIGDIIGGREGSELYFTFAGKHKWSICESNKNEYSLHYYPGEQELRELAGWSEDQWIDFTEIVTYRTRDLGTKEAVDSLSELYTIVKEKRFGMDLILDEIIETIVF